MIPATVTDALNSLQAQVNAAMPLEKASRPTISAIQLNAASLVALIDISLASAATLLNLTPPSNNVFTVDTWVAPTAPEDIINALNSIYVSAHDQWILSVMRGVLGRVAANVDQLLPVAVAPQPLKIYGPQPPDPIIQPPESGISFLGKFAQQGLKAFSPYRLGM
jgi:hypothetical protein